jgi:hypothetical protein
MAESVVGDPTVELPDPPEYPTTDIKEVDAVLKWVTDNYSAIADCCNSKGLPKPPQW